MLPAQKGAADAEELGAAPVGQWTEGPRPPTFLRANGGRQVAFLQEVSPGRQELKEVPSGAECHGCGFLRELMPRSGPVLLS